jgi:hypothetical protein
MPTIPSRALVLSLAVALAANGAFAASRFPNIKVNTNNNQPEETSIAINPVNPLNMVGAAQTPCRYYYTTNGGQTWTEGTLPDPYDLGDSQMAFDVSGNAYYCYIGQFSHSGIFINKSTNGGASWMPSGTAVIQHNGDVPFEDKPTHVTDQTTSPYRGSVYVGWTQFDVYGSGNSNDSTRILFAYSRNAGASYSAPIRVSDRGGNAIDSDNTVEGAVPAVGPDGTVYMAWAGPRGIEFDRSTNGGATWGADKVIADQPGGWDFAVSGLQRCNGLPVTKADISSGPHRGRVYVGWSDKRNGDTDVFLIHSDDGGGTWSPRVRVNTDPVGNGRDQFFPAFDVDPVTGNVFVVFYDRRQHADNLTTDVYLAVSTDGGDTFVNVRVSSSSFVPNAGTFFGDYIGLAAYNGHVRPLWMRMESSLLSVWTAIIEPPALTPEGPEVASLDASDGDAVATRRLVATPNPARARVELADASGVALGAPVVVVDVSGRVVRELAVPGAASPARALVWDTRDAAGGEVPDGVYFARTRDAEPVRIVVMR